jgi:thiol-disulfide isomerase/thioredoxin
MTSFATLCRPRHALALVLFAALGLLTACDGAESANGKPQPTPAAQKPANPAPQQAANAPLPIPDSALNAPIKTIDGQTVRLADYKGKVVIVNFWATWCGPCRQEMPHLVKLRQDLKDKGFEVIGVTHTGNDPDPEAVKAFAKQFRVNYPIGYGDANLVVGLQVNGVMNNIPQSFIISRQGQLVKRLVGFGGDYPLIMRSVAEELLNEKS